MAFLMRATSTFFRARTVSSAWRSLVAINSISATTSATRCTSSGYSISRFPVPERSSLPEDIQERMDTVEEKSGFLPNVFKALAHRPDEFRSFVGYYDTLMAEREGGLSIAEKELIIVATSASNNCLYCVVAHGAIHRIFSKQPLVADQVAISWECADITSRERAILKFAMKVARSEAMLDSDFEELESAGLSKEDAWDIGAVAAFFALSNRMAHLISMRPNDEFYSMGREKREAKE